MQKEITPVDLARKRGISLDYVYRELRVGKIAGRKRGKRWLIPVSELGRQAAAAG